MGLLGVLRDMAREGAALPDGASWTDRWATAKGLPSRRGTDSISRHAQ